MMSFNDRLLPDVLIESVSFSEHAVQITYFERSDLTQFVTLQRALLIDAEQVSDEVAELQEMLREVVDKALVLKRNPPKRLKRRPQAEVDDDDDGEEADSEVHGQEDRDSSESAVDEAGGL